MASAPSEMNKSGKTGSSRESVAMAGQSAQAGKSKGGRPSREALEALNRRILDTAAGLFASQGFVGTTMEQVASVCGAGKDTIYRRYPSKSALFTSLVEGLQSKIIAELDAQMEVNENSTNRLKRFARSLLSINLRPQMIALNRVALGEAVAFGGVRPTPAIEDPIMVRFTALVKEAQAESFLKEGTPLFIAEQLLYATSIKPLISAMLGESRFSDSSEEEEYFNQAWKLFLDGACS